MNRRAARRLPRAPPHAPAMAWSAVMSRCVMRAEGAVKVGNCSVKIFRTQVGLGQNHLRTCQRKVTVCPLHGTAAMVRTYRLWTRQARVWQRGQGDRSLVVLKVTTSVD